MPDCMSKESLLVRIDDVIDGLEKLGEKYKNGTNEHWCCGIGVGLLRDYKHDIDAAESIRKERDTLRAKNERLGKELGASLSLEASARLANENLALQAEVARLQAEMQDREKRLEKIVKGQRDTIVGDQEVYAKLQAEAAAIQQAKDGAYSERDKCVALIARMAVVIGLNAGIGRHPAEEEWDDDWRNIIFIDLPPGQVSWHIHDSELPMFKFLAPYGGKWDGHDTEEKYRRVLATFDHMPEEVE